MALEIAPSVPLSEVEWRVDGKPNNNQARFVPYVDATTTATLLDQWVGPGNWWDSYEPGEVAGKPALWCYLSVRVGDDDWVTKRDVGVASNFEAQKGMVSDAFKRVACIKWGVARNVYSLPTLWAPCRVSQKGDAYPNERTLPEIHKQLKQLGYEPSGKLSASESSDGATSASPTNSEAGTSAPSESSEAKSPKGGPHADPPSPSREGDPPSASSPGVSEGVDDETRGSGSSEAPSEDIYGLIVNALADKKLYPRVLAAANKVCLEKDVKPEKGISRQTVIELPEDVLEAVAAELHLRQGALA